MPIDPHKAVGAPLPDRTFSWTESDVLLYHLAVGAGHRPGDPTDRSALRYTLDDDRLQVLPSFGVVAPTFHEVDPPALDLPGCDIDLAKVLHGTQEIRLARPIPTAGSATLHTRIADVWDKGKAAVIVQEGTAVADDGEPLWTVTSSIFARGEGGFGGDRGPSTSVELPPREADATVDYDVTPQQALLYRLCGDRNPLHADPQFARRAGFAAPILHGLCSYGIVLREVVDQLIRPGVERVEGFSARFAGVVYPGETIRIRAWDEPGVVLVDARIASDDPARDDAPVLSDCVLTRKAA